MRRTKRPLFCTFVTTIALGYVAAAHAQNGSSQVQSAQTPQVDPFLQCLKDLAAEPQFEQLSHKLPLSNLANFTFAMLADESLPTPRERRDLYDWFERRDKCRQDSDALHRAQWPPEIYQVSTEGDAGIQAIGLDLYNRKITFGEANKRLEQLRNDIVAKLMPIIKQYQADIAEQNAAAERRQASAQQRAEQEQRYADAQAAQQELIRQQRAALFLNYMRAMQPRPLQVPQLPSPPPTYNTNCSTYGNMTDCTTH